MKLVHVIIRTQLVENQKRVCHIVPLFFTFLQIVGSCMYIFFGYIFCLLPLACCQ